MTTPSDPYIITQRRWEPSYDKPLYDDPPPQYEMTLHEANAAIKELTKRLLAVEKWQHDRTPQGYGD